MKITLIGRPNVGKSTLFNRICKKRVSIVGEQEGITRDRVYAEVEIFGHFCTLIDTGGIDPINSTLFSHEIQRQANIAIVEADVVIFVVDGQTGPHPLDGVVAKILLRGEKRVVVAVNKIDRFEDAFKLHEFHSLAIRDLIAVSAVQGYQVAELLEKVLKDSPKRVTTKVAWGAGICVAIVGRANVGKSTLLNHLLDEERSIVSSVPGTTRDAIDVFFERDGQSYIFVDTAGIRRKKSEKEVVDKFAYIRTKEAIARVDVCLLVLDSLEGLTVQEKRIAHLIEQMGKSCILIFNKWDLLKNFRMEHAIRGVREEIPFLSHCPILFISALKKRNLEKIFPLIKELYLARGSRVSTGELNRFIEKCLQKYHPPLLTGKRLRIYYMTQVEINPPKFVLFVNHPDLMTGSYRKYLLNHFRKAFGFCGSPIAIELRGKLVHANQTRLL